MPLPNLPGAHQYQNAGAAIAALRYLGFDAAACEAAVSTAQWPARMQRLKRGPVIDAAPDAEIWLDGGHNPAAGEAIGAHLASLPKRPTYLICGMLNTKDIGGYLRPMAEQAKHLFAVSIPGETNTLPAQDTANAALTAGMAASTALSVQNAVEEIVRITPRARILICGSLYLAGNILKTHE
jgi:dihydrofolate synthase/folylpolyglutamate synthase